MYNDKKFDLLVCFKNGKAETFTVTEYQLKEFQSLWDSPHHNRKIILKHLQGEEWIFSNTIESVSQKPMCAERLKANLYHHISLAPNLALQIALDELIRKELEPVKEQIRGAEKHLHYGLDNLREEAINPKSQEVTPRLSPIAKNTHLAKCCIAAEPTEAERLQAIKRAS